MKTSSNILNEKNILKKWISLSDTVKRYTNAFAFSIGLIAWIQAWPTIADNLLSDSTVAISPPSKTTSQSFTYEDILYIFIEEDVGLISTLKEKIANDCKKSWKVCDIAKEIKPLKRWEKVILSFFEDNLSKWWVNLELLLNEENLSTITDIFPHIEWLLKARYGEHYMDILNKKTIASSKYNLIINIKDGKNWNFIIKNIYLSENKKD